MTRFLPARVRRAFRNSVQHDSELLAERTGFERIVLLDPPFAYGRQMILEDENGSRRRVPYDADRVARQCPECSPGAMCSAHATRRAAA